jgi:YcxB-like protein
MNDAGTLVVEGAFQPQDYWRANRYLQNRMPRVWFARVFLLVMPWVVIAFMYLKDPANWSGWTLIVPVLFPIVVFVIMPLIDRAFLERRMQSIPSAYGLQSYSFSEHHIQIVAENKNVELKWSAIIKATESPSDFFLFLGANIAQFVPKRFLSATQETRLREVLKQNLADRARF